jgi:hypothetical protein
MADKWEMCMITGTYVYIWSTGKKDITLSHKDYARLLGKEAKVKNSDNSLGYFLDEGWEPFSSFDKYTHFLKRKIITISMSRNVELQT